MEMIQLATKKTFEVNLNGHEVVFELQLKNVQHLQTQSKKPLETILTKMEQGDYESILLLIYSMASDKKTGKILGKKFFKDFDELSIVSNLVPIIQELVMNEMPEANGDEKGK